MKLETIKLSELNPAEYNPRTITKEEFEGLKKSLETFGQQENLIVNKDMTVISGHQRLQAMKALGWTEAICNLVDLDKHQEKKLNVIMNSTAISGKYDDLKLSEILEELKLDDDYESLRLDKLEPLDLSDIEVEEDEAPEVSSEPPVSKLGEIYQLGMHRVMCGDSTDNASVEMLMNGDKADIGFTSPPYNAGDNIRGKFYANDDDNKTNDEYTNFLTDTTEIALSYCDYSFVNLQILEGNKLSLIDFQTNMRDYIKDILVWNKNIAPPHINKGTFATKWEYVFAFSKQSKSRAFPASWQGKYSNVIETENNSGNEYAKEHKAGFPVALPLWVINKMDFAKIVLDIFIGTGTTLIACEQTGRTCYGMEIDPKYVDVIRKRYWKFTHDGNEEGWEDGTTNSND